MKTAEAEGVAFSPGKSGARATVCSTRKEWRSWRIGSSRRSTRGEWGENLFAAQVQAPSFFVFPGQR